MLLIHFVRINKLNVFAGHLSTEKKTKDIFVTSEDNLYKPCVLSA